MMNNSALTTKAKGIGIYFILGLLILLFYYRDILDHEFSKMLFVLPLIGYSLISNYRSTIYLIALLMPLSFGLSTGYIFPIILMIYFVKKKKVPYKTIAFVFVLMFLEYIHYPFYLSNISFDPSIHLNYFSAWFIVAYLLYNLDKDVDVNRFLYFFCIGTIIFSVFVTWHSLKIFDTTGYQLGEARIGVVGMEDELESGKIYLRANPNTLAYFSVTAISVILVQLFRKQINIIFAIFSLIVLVVTGGMTMSRTWFILVGFSVLVFVMMNNRNGFKNVMISLLLLLVLLSIVMKTGDFISLLTERFYGDNTMSGRTGIFEYYNNVFLNNLDIFAIGTGAINYLKILGYRHAIHNGIQQILVCYGVVGFILLMIPFVRRIMVLCKKLSGVGTLMYLLPIIVVVVFLQTIQSIMPHQLLFPLVPAIGVLSLDQHLGSNRIKGNNNLKKHMSNWIAK